MRRTFICNLNCAAINFVVKDTIDFEVDGVFYYKTSYNTVAVTYKGNSYSSYSNEYAGDVVIPSSVNYNGTTYSVTSIGDYAFYF